MSTIVFLPWVQFKRQEYFDEFHLTPFRAGSEPFGADSVEQEQADRVLRSYCVTPEHPTQFATLLTTSGRSFRDDLSEVEAQAYFVFAELLAMSALSAREYFTHTSTNRDCFSIVVQNCQTGSNTVAVSTRRRDGNTLNAYPNGTYCVLCPSHVVLGRPQLDTELLSGLLKARTSDRWNQYYEAVSGFNLANTDSSSNLPTTEAVLMLGALQRLLDCRTGSANALSDHFHRLFTPTRRMKPGRCTLESSEPEVTARLQRATSVSDGWIRDFYALRGNLAHGKIGESYPSIWNVHEHLLFSAFVFPLLLKCALAEDGLYTISDDDQVDIDLFEELLCERHLEEHEEGTPNTHRWLEIRSPVRMAVRRMRLRNNGGRRVVDPSETFDATS